MEQELKHPPTNTGRFCSKCGEYLMNNDDGTMGYCFDCRLWFDYDSEVAKKRKCESERQ